MKKIILILSVAVLAACSSSSKKKSGNFELKGTLTDSKGETLVLEQLASQQPVAIDSCTIDEAGNFCFENCSPPIGFYRIKISDQNFAMLVLDSVDKVKVSGSAKDLGNTYKVEGSAETKLFTEYNELAKFNRRRVDSLQQAFQSAMGSVRMDSLRMDSLSKIFEGVFNKIIDGYSAQIAEKIMANTDKFASIMAIQPLDPDKYTEIFKALDAGLNAKFPENQNVKIFHQVVNRATATKSGGVAPDIDLGDTEGKKIALSSFRGKIVLVDFWASWCKPCRKEMPNVVKAYAKYKSKGFEIYGVSLDKDREAWREAIRTDGITWPQVSDLQFWDCVAAKAYNVQSIPYTVLLDREGKIIAKGLRGPELEKAIEKALASGGNVTASAEEPKKEHNHPH